MRASPCTSKFLTTQSLSRTLSSMSEAAAPLQPVDPRAALRARRRESMLRAREQRRVPLTAALDPAEKITPKDLTMTADPEAFEGKHLLLDARREDIARRIILQQSVAEIAAIHNLSERRVRIIMREPEMVATYLRVKNELLDKIDDVLFDEKTTPLLRARAQAVRAQTALSEILELVRARIAAGNARSSDMRVGMETAFGLIDRTPGFGLQRANGAGGAGVNVNVNVGSSGFRDGTNDLMRETIRESGVDLSDIAKYMTVDVDAERDE